MRDEGKWLMVFFANAGSRAGQIISEKQNLVRSVGNIDDNLPRNLTGLLFSSGRAQSATQKSRTGGDPWRPAELTRPPSETHLYGLPLATPQLKP